LAIREACVKDIDEMNRLLLEKEYLKNEVLTDVGSVGEKKRSKEGVDAQFWSFDNCRAN
jgi:hypothetical protein